MSAQATDDRVRRMQEGAQRMRDAVSRARQQLAQAQVPYDVAARELLDLIARDAPKDHEHAARPADVGRAPARRRSAARCARPTEAAMTALAQRAMTRPRCAQGCSRCGRPRAAHSELRAQPSQPRWRPMAALARGFCEACALDVFAALEHELERHVAGALARALNPDHGEQHDG